MDPKFAPICPAAPVSPAFFSSRIKDDGFAKVVQRVSPPTVLSADDKRLIGFEAWGVDLYDVANAALRGELSATILPDIFKKVLALVAELIGDGGVVHGDLKLENILFKDGDVAFIDFNGSALLSAERKGKAYVITAATPFTSVHPRAMAPLLRGQGVAHPSSIHDMYAIANTMLMLCMCFSGVQYVAGADGSRVPISNFWHPHGRGEDEEVEDFLRDILRLYRKAPSYSVETIMSRFSVPAVCAGHVAVAKASKVPQVKKVMKIVRAMHLAIDAFVDDNPFLSTRWETLTQGERIATLAREQEFAVALLDTATAALSKL